MADETPFDVVVIGAGPGGYVAAIRAAQLGLRVACVDRRARLGGTCLNIGCIPSKALLQASEKYAEARHTLARFGVGTGRVSLDLARMMAHKDDVVAANTRGVAHLFEKNGVARITGTARIVAAPRGGAGTVAVTADDGTATTLRARHIVVAAGSDTQPLPGVEIDEERVVSSTGALALAQVPKRLVVVGAGYIGLELGSVWQRLGAAVTVVEFLDRITPGIDGEVATAFQRTLRRQGLGFSLSRRVTGVERLKSKLKVAVEPAGGGAAETVDCDVVLVAIGRRPATGGLGLDEVGVATDAQGFVEIDEAFQTTAEGVFAIGDCVRGPMLAHKAEDEGVACAEILAGEAAHVNYGAIPAIVYTSPEVAAVGKTEEELAAAGVDYRAGSFPFTANGRARANLATDGFVKLLADAASDRILGAHIIGPDAGTLIHELVLAIEFGASAEDVARTCHGHPTLAEAVKEAALAVAGRPIHI